MIVYSSTKTEFAQDVFNNVLVDKLVRNLQDKNVPGTSPGHVRSYQNSLHYMERVLRDQAIPENSGIAIEYVIPYSSKRIDFIISGRAEKGTSSVILVELKQWSSAELTVKDAIVRTFEGAGMREKEHPSYQAWSYAALLEDFNESVRQNHIALKPCAYLHNYSPDQVMTNPFYAEHIRRAPVFLKHDGDKLTEFIKKFIKFGDSGEILYLIENGRIRPSKSLADALSSMLKGNKEFVMIDDQKIVLENALDLFRKKPKQVMIVEGGPGTGKSVVAVNLLVAALTQRQNVQYVTKNRAPRDVYESKLSNSFRKSRISNLFKGSGAYTDCAPDVFDMLVVDEAHRLNERSGLFQNRGENQIKEIIAAAKHTVFFLDEDQKVTLKDIGEKEEIERWAKKCKATIHRSELSSQFRCNGSNGYLAWLDNTLQKRETVNTLLFPDEYDFRIVSSPNDLRDIIFEKNRLANKARMVAGYCWKWVSKKDPSQKDIVIPEHDFSMQWNLANDGNLWIIAPEAVNQVGCIHTCQGLELDHVGVIVGPDLICRSGKIITDPSKRASTDASVKGYGRLSRQDPEGTRQLLDSIIKNTYKTLMTRGMKSCHAYFTDPETAEYFQSRVQPATPAVRVHPTVVIRAEDKFKKAIVAESVVATGQKYVDYLPVYSLAAACGYFGSGTNAEKEGWLKVSLKNKLDRNMFVTKVCGSSMVPLISDGNYCVFRANVVGSRRNKIVLVQQNKISDPDTGGSYTVKKYTSRKNNTPDGSWEHAEIVLLPLNPAYAPIIVSESDAEELMVIAEFVTVL